MTSKKFVKAFIAGMSLPAVILPIVFTLLYLNVHAIVMQRALEFIPMYLPLVWGFANALFVKFNNDATGKKANKGLIITGLVLGLLVAIFGVFIAHIPMRVFGNSMQEMQYAPLVVIPVVYAILFRYVVRWLNKVVGL
ncbi:MAG TPA: hypothetical protein VLG38_01795 [Gammaproteobacteria bacterium]|nr:hypothetical protein [Gammaproteobacteria bacterium]